MHPLLGPDGLPITWRVFAVVAFPLWVIYLATAAWTLPYNVDPLTNAITAWSIGTRGSPLLPEYEAFTRPEYVGRSIWVVDGLDGPVSKFPPGAPLLAAPLYATFAGDVETVDLTAGPGDTPLPAVTVPVPSLAPSAIVGSATTAVAMGFLALAFARLHGTVTGPVLAALVAGLGTGAWSVAANALWQHGPAMMWLALAIWAAASERWWLSGLSFGMAALTRPLAAVVAAAVGLIVAVSTRRLRPAVAVGCGAGVGIGLLVLYNRTVFGSPTLTGGYDLAFEQWFVDEGIGRVENVVLALVSPDRGILVWSSFLALILVGITPAWRRSPVWVRAAASGGLALLGITYWLGYYRGGGGYLFYRYPLEALVALAPLFFVAAVETVRRGSLARAAVLLASALSIVAHGAASLIT
jgi:hypothetical protein